MTVGSTVVGGDVRRHPRSGGPLVRHVPPLEDNCVALPKECTVVDLLDRALLDCLQIAPRATWKQLSLVLRVNPSTLSRRWHQLNSSAAVWSTCNIRRGPDGGRLICALVQIALAGGDWGPLMDRLSRDPDVVTLEFTSGSHGMLLTLTKSDLAALQQFVDVSLRDDPIVRATTVHVLRSMVVEGGHFRLHELSEHMVQRCERFAEPGTDRLEWVDPGTKRQLHALAVKLHQDARLPLSALAAATEMTPARTRLALNTLLADDWVRLRTDFAPRDFGLEASVYLGLETPPGSLESVILKLSTMSSVRLVATVASWFNLIVCVWLPDLESLDRLESSLVTVHPGLRIAERWIAMSAMRRMGKNLDATSGRLASRPADPDSADPDSADPDGVGYDSADPDSADPG